MSSIAHKPKYQLLPPLSLEDEARLKESIKERGVKMPVVFDEHGDILDGHNRVMIADSLGIDYPSIVERGLDEHEKRIFVAELNAARRQLTDAQKVLLGIEIEPDIRAKSEERRNAQLKQNQQPALHSSSEEPLVTTVTNGDANERKSSAEIAQKVQLGSHMAYERGKKAIEAVKTEIEDEDLRDDLLDRISYGEIDLRGVRKEVNNYRSERRMEDLAAKSNAPMPTEERTYPVIYADPPWQYQFSETDARKIENHYPTMTADEIASMDIPSDDDAILFLWATNPKLQEAMKVIDGWGFTYVTNMVWVKDKIGMGYYARSKHELLLIARKGKLPVPQPADRPDSVIEGKRTEHSSKPHNVYEIIERMYPGFAKLELFCRTPQEGWAVWGNQSQ